MLGGLNPERADSVKIPDPVSGIYHHNRAELSGRIYDTQIAVKTTKNPRGDSAARGFNARVLWGAY